MKNLASSKLRIFRVSNIDIPIIWTPIVYQTVLSLLYRLVNNFQSLLTAFVLRTENPNKFRKAERKAEVKFEPKVKLNCLDPISYNNVKIWLNLRAKLFFFYVKQSYSITVLEILQSSETGNVIGRSRSNYGEDARLSRWAADEHRKPCWWRAEV